jgi:hypothetical protein
MYLRSRGTAQVYVQRSPLSSCRWLRLGLEQQKYLSCTEAMRQRRVCAALKDIPFEDLADVREVHFNAMFILVRA